MLMSLYRVGMVGCLVGWLVILVTILRVHVVNGKCESVEYLEYCLTINSQFLDWNFNNTSCELLIANCGCIVAESKLDFPPVIGIK